MCSNSQRPADSSITNFKYLSQDGEWFSKTVHCLSQNVTPETLHQNMFFVGTLDHQIYLFVGLLDH